MSKGSAHEVIGYCLMSCLCGCHLRIWMRFASLAIIGPVALMATKSIPFLQRCPYVSLVLESWIEPVFSIIKGVIVILGVPAYLQFVSRIRHHMVVWDEILLSAHRIMLVSSLHVHMYVL